MIRKPNFKLNWKYALGELLLIFLGISLAIAFQNWNDQRKEKVQLKGYLSAIQKNLQSDTVAIIVQDKRYKRNQQMAEAYLRNLFLEQYDMDTLGMALEAAGEQYLKINQSGFEALKSSGYISKLQGMNIEEKLFQYYHFFDKVYEQERSLNNFIETMEAKFFDMTSESLINTMKLFNFVGIEKQGKLTQTKDQIIKNIYENTNVIGILQRTADEDSRQYEIMLKNATELLELIGKQLNN